MIQYYDSDARTHSHRSAADRTSCILTVSTTAAAAADVIVVVDDVVRSLLFDQTYAYTVGQ